MNFCYEAILTPVAAIKNLNTYIIHWFFTFLQGLLNGFRQLCRYSRHSGQLLKAGAANGINGVAESLEQRFTFGRTDAGQGFQPAGHADFRPTLAMTGDGETVR